MQRVCTPTTGGKRDSRAGMRGHDQCRGAWLTQWLVGQPVCALLVGGGYAETVVCSAEHILPLPRDIPFRKGAALAEVFCYGLAQYIS